MLIAIVIAVLALLISIWGSVWISEEKEFREIQSEQIRRLLIIGDAHRKFIDFLSKTLSDDSVDPELRDEIFRYLHDTKIDLNSDGEK